MPRAKGKTDQVMRLQEDLDCITGALVGWEIAERILRLRIEQARQRTGLDELLSPALTELDEMSKRVRAAKMQVSHTLTRLTE
ncbi:MAG: hypothetical protein CVU44_20920 [Chloroflexi bacterium HGW-Chloroflexi-6]|nr:MAG: hypothetical protein CVU44_20920 [Chloroflexi bacterium HGW-Chloroflexi-6]